MLINDELLEQICTCEETTCTKPHTLKELESKLKIDINDNVITLCPKCKSSKEVTTFAYKNKLEAYCVTCNLNFFAKTGEIIDVLEEDEIEYIDEVTQTKPKKHTMSWDGNFYQCDMCTFETQFLSEVTMHENASPVETKEEDKNLHYVNFKSKDLWMCYFCKKEFDSYQSGIAHETPEGVKAYRALPKYSSFGTSYVSTHCTHNPEKVIYGEGWEIYAGRKWDCESNLNDFDLVLNLTGSRISKRHEIPIKSLKKWESREKFTEICLDWPDRGIVSLPVQFWKDLAKHIQDNKLKVILFCMGGHGRTGTAVASLLVTILGWQPKEATEWVWENYCDQAIETNSQINYVYNLVGQTYDPPKQETKSLTQINNQTSTI